VWESFRDSLHLTVDIKNEVIQEVKTICTSHLKASPEKYDVIFTSNTTEAINIVAENMNGEKDAVILNTFMEHSSNDLPWRVNSDSSPLRLDVNTAGFINLTEMENLLKEYNREKLHGNKRITMVSVCGASNVLGICNNLAEISKIAHKQNAKILVDGAQLVAHKPVDLNSWDIDYFTFSAHKVYAPFGTAVLMTKKALQNIKSNRGLQISFAGNDNILSVTLVKKQVNAMMKSRKKMVFGLE
jgi:selenocysteine lyase/cysteine desulfurase